MDRLSVSVIAVGCLLLAGTAVPAFAQSAGIGTRPTLGVYGGLTFPRGDLTDEVGAGWNAGAMFKIRAYKALDLRLDGTYIKFGRKDIEGTTVPIQTDGEIRAGTVSGLLNLGPDSAAYPGDNSVSPYLIGGIGKYRLNYDATCNGCSPSPDPGIKTHWGVNLGFGATAPIVGVRTFFEARYNRLSRSLGEGGARSFFLLSAGIKIR
ncbi:MAG: outer membrane beta-barrel protein [Gemmatimonadaceae bacterium]